MLTDLLAWSVAIASLGLYVSAFFLPELYRKFDLVSSGAGLFFALTLWIYGDRIRGGLLLGETAAVVLLLWFGWQTLQYRWQLTHERDRTDTQKAKTLWSQVQSFLPGSKSDSEGTPPKVAGKIAEFLGGIDLDKIKSQFQKGDKKAPTPPVETTKDTVEADSSSSATEASPPVPASVASESVPTDAWDDAPEFTPEPPSEPTVVDTVEPSLETTTEAESISEIVTIDLEPTPDPTPAIAPDAPEGEPAPASPEITQVPEATESTPPETSEPEPSEVLSAADIINDIPEQSDDEEESKAQESGHNTEIVGEQTVNPKDNPDSENPHPENEDQTWPPPDPTESA